ncbi:MAG: methylated-DNA--[protein]-cysteine S-methyltransferase [Candidatus Limnocylindria bacterium]
MSADDLETRLARSARASFDSVTLRAGLARRAGDAGILDVAYAPMDSPLGELTVFVTRRGLVRLSYPGEPIESQLQQLADRISPRILAAPERTDGVRRQLDEYFAARRRSFEVPIDWRLVAGFAGDVLRATARVPYGGLSTYREVAVAAGSPRAYRAAGNALGANPMPIVVPCHRVVHSGGGLGGYTGGLARKEFLLQLEGARSGRLGAIPALD